VVAETSLLDHARQGGQKVVKQFRAQPPTEARRKAKKDGKPTQAVPVNASLFLAPSAPQAAKAIRLYLDWQTHRQALRNAPIWHALYRSGLVRPEDPEPEREAAALRLLGFAPVSPDGAPYTYDSRADEVVNARHGSPRQPRFPAGPSEPSPLQQLFDRLQSVRADLRFREDGVHTVLTIERTNGQGR
jgi:hypothetical protein